MARGLRGIKKPHPLGSVPTRSGYSQTTANLAQLSVVPAATSATASGVKISELPSASAANGNDQLEVNQAGTSRRVTVDQIAAAVAGGPPSGVAGGDLAGTYPDPTLAPGVVQQSLNLVDPRGFGAIGNGVADDTTAMQAAITAAAGRTLDGAGLTYKIMLPLTGVASNTTIRNATFDFSAMPAQPGNDDCLSAVGTVGSDMTLTSDTLAGSNVVNIASTTSLAADDLVFFTSTTQIDSSTGATCGQYERVKTIVSGTQFTTCTTLAVSFLTSATAVVKKVSALSGVTIRDCVFVGAGANSQLAINMDWCDRPRILHCAFTNFDRAATQFLRCHRPLLDGCTARKATAAGLAYGYVVSSGCYHAKIVNSFGEDVRHTVTIGGTTGISLYTLVANCHAINSKDAGFDSHSSAMFTTFSNNHVEMSAEQFLTSTHNGMISQSGHTTFIGNTVKGFMAGGIVYQPTASGVGAGAIITNNKIILHDTGVVGTSGAGISIDNNATLGVDIDKVSISGNMISGGASSPGTFGILAYNHRSGARIRSLAITGNQITDAVTNAILVRLDAGALVDLLNISNNDVETAGTRAIYLRSDGTGSVMANVTGSGNTMKSTQIGLALFTGTGAVLGPGKFGSNIYRSITDANIIQVVGPGASSVTFKDSFDNNTTNFPNSTATVLPHTVWYTFSRGAAQVVTMPDPTLYRGTELHFQTIAAGTVDSATANITPLTGAAAATTIFPATAGKWAVLRSDGTTWRIVKGN